MPFIPYLFAILFLAYPLVAFYHHSIKQGFFWETLNQYHFWEALWVSVSTSMISMLLLLICITPLSAWLAYQTKQGKYISFFRCLNLLLLFYVTLPPAVLGLMLLISYGRQSLGDHSLALSRYALILVQVMIGGPWLLQQQLREFMKISLEYDLLAQQLEIKAIVLLRRVYLPWVRSGLIKGAIFVWARILGEFGATLIFAGNISGVSKTLTIEVYEMLSINIAQAQWMALFLCWLVAGLFLLGEVLDFYFATQGSIVQVPKD
jgi:molybdate transport system permease protein